MDKNKELQRQQEDAAFAHGLWWVGGTVILEALLILLKKARFDYTSDMQSIANSTLASNMIKMLCVIGPVVVVLALVMAFMNFKKTGAITPVIEGVLGFSSVATLAIFMTYIYDSEGASIMMLFIPVIGALAFSFFLYQHDFFYAAALPSMAALVLWMIWHQTENTMPVYLIGSVKVIAFGAIFCWLISLLKKSGGTLTLLGYTIRFVPHDAVYPAIYASVAISAVAVVLALVLGSQIAFYLIYAMAAWVFALLVYYTVRML